MFATILIVFRESLEAALFVGIVAAATRRMPGRNSWLASGVGLGVAGALLLALAADTISSWADGVGQDLVNICVLSAALAMLLWHCIWVSAHARDMALQARRLGSAVSAGDRKPWALLMAVALAVLREGAETVLFVAGTLGGRDVSISTVVGSVAVGLAAGVGAGSLLYAGLSRIPARQIFSVTNVLIALLAANIASQLAKALAQSGLIEFGSTPLWDTSHALAQDSVLGTFLHALVGYEVQPSAVQFMSYVAVLALIYAGTRMMRPKTA